MQGQTPTNESAESAESAEQWPKGQPARSHNSRLVVSYLLLRKSVGCLGMLLPFVLIIGGSLLFGLSVQDTVSDYYHTGMRDVFVGTLCAMGVFLYSYNGYSRKDNRAGNLASLFVIATALFPTTPIAPSPLAATLGKIHVISAVSYFLTLAYFSLILFTKTDPLQPPTPQKLKRNKVYRICGYTILGAIALIALYLFTTSQATREVISESFDPIFWLESVAIFAFGISWYVKGEGLLKDK